MRYLQKEVKVSDNDLKEDRDKGRAMAKVYRALYEAKKDRTDLRKDKKWGEVYAGKVRVARWDGEKMKLKGEALPLKARIEELIAEKRKYESDSE